MAIAAVQLVFADERSDSVLLTHLMELPEEVTDEDTWAEELHQEFRKVVLGERADSTHPKHIDYFGHWIEVRVKLDGVLSLGTLQEFFEKAREEIVDNHGEPDEWRRGYWQ